MRFCFVSRALTTPFLSLCVVLGLAAQALAQADLYNVHFRAAAFTAAAGETVTVGIGIANQPLQVTGFSFGVKHDMTKLSIESVDLGPAITQALGAGTQPDERFFALDLAPVGGTGFTVAMILSADQAGVALPAGLANHVFDVKYKIAQAVSGTAKLDITGDLSNANHKVDIILDANGVAKKPIGTPAPVISATVTISTGPAPYVRGDMNQSNRLEVTDATLIIDYLFGGGSLPAGQNSRANCLASLNFDGSTSKGTPDIEDAVDIDLTDVINLLVYLFRLGAPPPAPFPRCGQPALPVAADITCKAFTCR